MKWILNSKSKKENAENIKKERTERIAKEINEKYEEYLQMYSYGFSIKELKEEIFKTKEEIMVIGCNIDVLKEEVKIPKNTNDFLEWSIIIFSILASLIFKNKLISLITLILNLFIIYSTLKRINLSNLSLTKKNEILDLEKESLYLELKIKVLESIIKNKI